MAERSYTWTVGPAESALVRWLLNFAGGSLLVGFVSILVPVEVVLSRPPAVAVLLLGILIVIKTAAILIVLRESPVYWLFEAYASTGRPIEVSVATVAVIGLYPVIPLSNRLASRLLLLVCLGLFVGAKLTSSKGELDTDTGTLAYTGSREYEIPLASVSSLERYTIGGRTYLWLSFRRSDGTPVDQLVFVPTAVWRDARHLVEGAIGTADAAEESSRSSRVELLAGLLVFGTLVVGASAPVYVATGEVLLVVVLLPLFLVPFAVVVVSYFSDVFATPDRR